MRPLLPKFRGRAGLRFLVIIEVRNLDNLREFKRGLLREGGDSKAHLNECIDGEWVSYPQEGVQDAAPSAELNSMYVILCPPDPIMHAISVGAEKQGLLNPILGSTSRVQGYGESPRQTGRTQVGISITRCTSKVAVLQDLVESPFRI